MNSERCIFENCTDNNFTAISNVEKINHISVSSHIINLVYSVLTVSLNALVLNRIRTHRKKIPDVIFKQTLCLCVTDLLAGLTPAIFCLTLLEQIYTNVRACLLIPFVYSVAQLAVLLNLCILSIRRWIVLRQTTLLIRSAKTSGNTLFYLVCPWLISFIGHAPLIKKLISTDISDVNGCFSESLMADRRLTLAGFGIFTSVLFVLTLFYIRSIIILKQLKKSTGSDIHGRGERLQGKAFKNLLTVLIVANCTTLPLLVWFIVLNFRTSHDSENMYFVVQTQALNSLLNPIVYSAQISEIRGTTGERFSALLHRLFQRCLQ